MSTPDIYAPHRGVRSGGASGPMQPAGYGGGSVSASAYPQQQQQQQMHSPVDPVSDKNFLRDALSAQSTPNKFSSYQQQHFEGQHALVQQQPPAYANNMQMQGMQGTTATGSLPGTPSRYGNYGKLLLNPNIGGQSASYVPHSTPSMMQQTPSQARLEFAGLDLTGLFHGTSNATPTDVGGGSHMRSRSTPMMPPPKLNMPPALN